MAETGMVLLLSLAVTGGKMEGTWKTYDPHSTSSDPCALWPEAIGELRVLGLIKGG